MNYLVTGGTGFVGAYAVKALVEAGHRVTVFDLMLNREYLADVLGRPQVDEVQLISGDVTDLPAVLRAMGSAEAQRVVHLAATLSVGSEVNPLRTLKVNCEGTVNVFEAALALGVNKVVWASSVAVFGISGEREGFIENNAHHEPTGLYGAVKSFNESLGMHYKKRRGLDNIGLRFTVAYGYGKGLTVARGTGADFVTELLEKPAIGEAGVIRNGNDTPDFLYAEDAGRALHLASEAPPCPLSGLTICGSTGSMRDAVALVKRLLPDADLRVEDGLTIGAMNYDPSVTEDAIGYSPQFTLEDGFRATINAMRRKHGLPQI